MPQRKGGVIRILIADDHEIFRRGLRSLLESHPEWEVCGEAVDGQEAVDRVKELNPDVVVLDITMPRLNGLEAAQVIRSEAPQSKMVILSQHEPSLMRGGPQCGRGCLCHKIRSIPRIDDGDRIHDFSGE